MKTLFIYILSAFLFHLSLHAQTVHWQARMNDSCTVVLRTAYDKTLTIAGARVNTRGSFRSEAVECRNVQVQVEKVQPPVYSYSCDFEYRGTYYRLRGFYADDSEGAPRQSVKCIALTLSDDFLRKSGQGGTRR